MQQSPKAPEPSMEEILASIRKIIADDPVARPAVPASAGPTEAPATAVATTPTIAKPTERNDRAELDRELADLLGEPAPSAGTAPTSARQDREPVFGQPSAEPAAAPAEPTPSRFGWMRSRASPAASQAAGQNGAHTGPQLSLGGEPVAKVEPARSGAQIEPFEAGRRANGAVAEVAKSPAPVVQASSQPVAQPAAPVVEPAPARVEVEAAPTVPVSPDVVAAAVVPSASAPKADLSRLNGARSAAEAAADAAAVSRSVPAPAPDTPTAPSPCRG